MDPAAEHVVGLLKDWLNDAYPGSVLPWRFIETLDGFEGFGVAVGPALSLIFIDSTEQRGWNWSVSIYGGIALDVPDMVNALFWCNAQNRSTQIGRYYAAAHREKNSAALICENSIPGVHLEAVLLRNSGLTGYLRGLVQGSVEWAAEDANNVHTTLGGRPFPPDENGLMTLLHCGSSG